MLIFHEHGSLAETALAHGIALEDLDDLATQATDLDGSDTDREVAADELAAYGIEVLL